MKLHPFLLISLFFILFSCSKKETICPSDPLPSALTGPTKHIKYIVSEGTFFDSNGEPPSTRKDSTIFYYSDQFELKHLETYKNGKLESAADITIKDGGAIVEKQMTAPESSTIYTYRYFFNGNGGITRQQLATKNDGIILDEEYENGVKLRSFSILNQKNQLIWLGDEKTYGLAIGQSPCNPGGDYIAYSDVLYVNQPLRTNYHWYALISDEPVLMRSLSLISHDSKGILLTPPKSYTAIWWQCEFLADWKYNYNFNYQFSENRITFIKSHLSCLLPKEGCYTEAKTWIGYY